MIKLLLLCRKRKGGIKLADEPTESRVEEELNSSTASNDPAAELCKTLESDDTEHKEKADALWADFLKDVGSVPKKCQSADVVSISVVCRD